MPNPILDGSRAFNDTAGTSYTFTYTVELDVWDGSNPITVVVKNDQVVKATDANGREPDGAFTFRDFFTLTLELKRSRTIASTSCEFREVDELRYDANHAVVYPELPTSGGDTCTSDRCSIEFW